MRSSNNTFDRADAIELIEALDRSRVGVFRWNVGEDRIEWSRGTYAVFGLTSHEEVTSFAAYLVRVHPEDRAEVETRVREVLADPDGHLRIEHRVIRSNGSTAWISAHGQVFRDPDGSPSRVMGIVSDVTEAKLTRLHLEKSQEQLTALLETTPYVAIQIYDRQGRVKYWNHASTAMFGYSAEEARGKTLDQLIHSAEEMSAFHAILDQIADTGRIVGPAEYDFRRRDGTWGRCYSTTFEIPSHTGERLFVCMDVDITDKARLVEQEKESRARAETERRRMEFLAEVSKAVGSSIQIQSSLDALVVSLVPHLADFAWICMWEREDEQVHSAAYMPDVGAEVATLVDGARTHGRTVSLTEKSQLSVALASDWERLKEHGCFGLRDASLAAWTALRIDDVHVVPIVIRESSRGALLLGFRRTPRPFTQCESHVLDEVVRRAALAIENACLFEETVRSLTSRDEFIAIASHELRTPLTALKMHLQLLERMARTAATSSLPSDKIQFFTAAAGREVDRYSHLIEDLLQVSLISVGRMTLARQPTDLTELTRGVLERLAPQVASANAHIDVSLSHVEPGSWDRNRLEQVIENLLSNAIKFGAGSPIEVRLRPEDASVVLEVTDHGIGIPKEKQARIFDRFERAVSERNFGGLGLGLYISREIARLHGGTLTLQSEPGQGTTFRLQLPVG